MNRTIFVVFLLLCSVSASADVYETGFITQLQMEGQDLVVVWLDGPNDSSECSLGERWTVSKSSDAAFDEKLSFLLAAKAAHQQVKLRHLTSWGCGTWNSNKIYSIQLTDN